MRTALVPSGGSVSFGGWKKPVAEPEIAVHMGRDLAAGADRDTVKAAIAGLGPAIELADLDPLPEDIETVLKGNIFQRHVVLGENDRTRAGGKLDGLTCRVIRRGAEAARTTDPQANIGELIAIVQHVANLLPQFGEKLSAGDVIITGSTVPPLFIDPDEVEIGFALDPIGELSVRFER
jgi:2-keto-4-pentenoate hydratase